MQIAIINGPNLNLLGKRETDIYGNEDFDVYYVQLKSQYTQLELSYYQSNSEGEIVSKNSRIRIWSGWNHIESSGLFSYLNCNTRCYIFHKSACIRSTYI